MTWKCPRPVPASMCRLAIPGIVIALLFGCARTAPVVVAPAPESTTFITGPLPGVDSTVIQDVVGTFDSTFVEASAEIQAQRSYLEGRALFERVDSMLTVMVGPSALDGSPSEPESVDTVAFVEANDQARQVLAQAARAQASEDSVLAQTLLGQAQGLLERAVSLNPWHEEAHYQLAQVYAIRADRFKQAGAWEQVLDLLRGRVALRADEHGLWAEMALTLDNLERFATSALTWRQAAEVMLDDVRLTFGEGSPPVDSLTLFSYNIRAYQAFVNGRDGEGTRYSLAQAWKYASSDEEDAYARRELTWAQWDYENFENRLVFDSLRSAAASDPLGVRSEIGMLIPKLTRPSARLEASYNYAILSYDNGLEDIALDTLQVLWHDVDDSLEIETVVDADTVPATAVGGGRRFVTAADSLAMDAWPYVEFKEDLGAAYATFLFERALAHRQLGNSALAFTYLMQVVQIESEYTGKAYIESLKLARYNPKQVQQLEPRIEAVFSTLDQEDKLVYLVQMGSLYRRLGQNDKVTAFLQRYRALRGDASN